MLLNSSDARLLSHDKEKRIDAFMLKMVLLYPDRFYEISSGVMIDLIKPSLLELAKMVHKLQTKREFDENAQPAEPSKEAVKPEKPTKRSLTIPSPPLEVARTPQEIDGICVKLAFHPFSEEPLISDWSRYFKATKAKETVSAASCGRPEVSQLFKVDAKDSKFAKDLQSLASQTESYLSTKKGHPIMRWIKKGFKGCIS